MFDNRENREKIVIDNRQRLKFDCFNFKIVGDNRWNTVFLALHAEKSGFCTSDLCCVSVCSTVVCVSSIRQKMIQYWLLQLGTLITGCCGTFQTSKGQTLISLWGIYLTPFEVLGWNETMTTDDLDCGSYSWWLSGISTTIRSCFLSKFDLT